MALYHSCIVAQVILSQRHGLHDVAIWMSVTNVRHCQYERHREINILTVAGRYDLNSNDHILIFAFHSNLIGTHAAQSTKYFYNLGMTIPSAKYHMRLNFAPHSTITPIDIY